MKAITKLKTDIKVLQSTETPALLILGEGGLGKTKTVLDELKGTEYIYLNGTVTPLKLYKELYFNQEKLIVLDDVEGLFDNNRAIGLLKGALWDANGKRLVTYDTTSYSAEDVPSQFEFKGKIIIITNNLPVTNKHIQALKTRTLYTEISYTFKEKKELIKEITLKSKEFKEIKPTDRKAVWKELDKAITPAVQNFNFRHVKQSFQYFLFSKQNSRSHLAWRSFIPQLFEVDPIKQAIVDIWNDRRITTEKSRVAKFMRETGKSRATYFNYKKIMK